MQQSKRTPKVMKTTFGVCYYLCLFSPMQLYYHINIRYGQTDSLGNILGGLSVIKLTENNTRVRLAEIFDRLDNLTPKFIFGEFAIDYYVIRNLQK